MAGGVAVPSLTCGGAAARLFHFDTFFVHLVDCKQDNSSGSPTDEAFYE